MRNTGLSYTPFLLIVQIICKKYKQNVAQDKRPKGGTKQTPNNVTIHYELQTQKLQDRFDTTIITWIIPILIW